MRKREARLWELNIQFENGEEILIDVYCKRPNMTKVYKAMERILYRRTGSCLSIGYGLKN